jgi:hypothetical protein
MPKAQRATAVCHRLLCLEHKTVLMNHKTDCSRESQIKHTVKKLAYPAGERGSPAGESAADRQFRLFLADLIAKRFSRTR